MPPVAATLTDTVDGLQWDYSCSDDVLSAWIGRPQPCHEIVMRFDTGDLPRLVAVRSSNGDCTTGSGA